MMLRAAEDHRDKDIAHVAQASGEPGLHKAGAVLVVEDEVMIRLAISGHLRQRGYRVLEASSGEDAQRVMAAGEGIALVFADINLGRGINGLELARWLRATHPQIRILLSSGRYGASAAAGLADAPLLAKPYAYDALAAVIEDLLRSH